MKTIVFISCMIACCASAQFGGLQSPGVVGALSFKEPSGAASPSFVGEIQRGATTEFDAITQTITLSSGISSGNRAVVLHRWNLGSSTVVSATDSRGNAWSVDGQMVSETTRHQAILSAHVGTALQAGDTITLTYSATNTSYRTWLVASLSGVASSSQVDVTTNNNSFGTSVSATASTTAANTVAVGIVQLNAVDFTYGSGNWDAIGAVQEYTGSGRGYYLKKVLSSAGSQNPGGTITGNKTWACLWVAYK